MLTSHQTSLSLTNSSPFIELFLPLYISCSQSPIPPLYAEFVGLYFFVLIKCFTSSFHHSPPCLFLPPLVIFPPHTYFFCRAFLFIFFVTYSVSLQYLSTTISQSLSQSSFHFFALYFHFPQPLHSAAGHISA